MQVKSDHRFIPALSIVAMIAFGTLLIPAMLRAATDKPAATTQAAHSHAGGDDHEKLEHAMEDLEKAFKQMRKQVKDASKNESSLALTVQMQQAVLAAKALTPPMIAKMPADKQADAKISYRQMMVNLLRHSLDLESNLISGDNTKAAAALEEMHELEHAGHDEFRPKKAK